MKNSIYIGDNLEIMQSDMFKKYVGKVGLIYIDPPYNTSSKAFAFSDKNDKWSEDMSERLALAYNLLNQEGCIFISIDDNELANLLNIGYKIFGKENYVGLFITKQAQRSNAKHINIIHEYVVCFAKCKKKMPKFYIKRLENPSESEMINSVIKKVKKAFEISPEAANKELKKCIDKYVKETGTTWIKNYSNIDNFGNIFFAKDLSTPGKPNRLDIPEINMHLKPLKTRGWTSKEKMLKLHKENRISYKNGRPYEIEYIYEATNNVSSILDYYSRQGTNDLKKMGLYGLFDTPKPVELIKFLIRCSLHKDTTILDFYAGSGTTAQAVYEINSEDSKNHNYILIQNDEPINPKNDAYALMKQKGFDSPSLGKALLLRIDTYLELNNMKKDYSVIKA